MSDKERLEKAKVEYLKLKKENEQLKKDNAEIRQLLVNIFKMLRQGDKDSKIQ